MFNIKKTIYLSVCVVKSNDKLYFYYKAGNIFFINVNGRKIYDS